MDTHALADLLKSRRANDIKFEVEVAMPGHDDGDTYMVEMEDDHQRIVSGAVVAPEDVLTYDSENDFLLLRLGCIFLGDPEAKAPPILTTEEWATILQALKGTTPLLYDRVGWDVFTKLRNKIQQAL